MTMENMGELPDQQINDSSVTTPLGSSSGGVDTTSQSHGDTTQSESDFPAVPSVSAVSSPEAELSPTIDIKTEAIQVSMASMIDTSEYRTQMGDVTYQTLNGRMSPGYSPNSYATLTPLQPLPPISTVSDKFNHIQTSQVSGNGFTLMNNGLGLQGMDMNTAMNTAYRYDKMMGMNVGPSLATSPMTMMTNGYSQGVSPYSYNVNVSLGAVQNGLPSPKSEHKSPTGLSPNYEPYRNLAPQTSSRLHSPNPMMSSLNGLHVTNPAVTPDASPNSHGSSPVRGQSVGPMDSQSNKELEEINTKELAQRISSELKRYSIPQAVFAQRVLCRSQGTLSDLLRNPKPWSKLKSGRETFRRMWKWLQEPEFQRMSALRLAGKICHHFSRCNISFRCFTHFM